MDWKNQLTKTPYLILFIVLISVGVGTASALITITLAGDVEIEGNLDMTNGKISNLVTPSVPADAATKEYVDSLTTADALDLLGCTIDQIARFDGNNWVCVKLTAKNNPITIVDNTEETGATSIAIGADGLPVISYWEDLSDTNLVVVHCGNTLCSSGNTKTVVDSAEDVGDYSSIAIGVDGLPVISYRDRQNGDLKVVHCGNTLCNSGNIITPVDSTVDDVGRYTSIAIGADNNPIISYYDLTNDDLKIVHCGNILCNSGNDAKKIVGGAVDNQGQYTSIAIGVDGLPVISYYSVTSAELKFVRCNNIVCDFAIENVTIDTAANIVGLNTSIAIGVDGLPVISYHDETNGDLKVVHCGNMSCNGANTITAVDSTDDVGEFTSIAIGTDGNPVISYYDFTNKDLKVTHCGNPFCSSNNKIITLDRDDFVGQLTSIAIGTDGNPVISYRADTNLGVAVDGTVLIFE